MRVAKVLLSLGAVSTFVAIVACGGGGGGSSSVPAASPSPSAGPTQVPASTLSFTSIGSAPATIPAASATAVPLPMIAGVTGVGGGNGDALTMLAATPVTAVVSVTTATGTGGPPAALQNALRRTMAIGGVTITPLYYVGVTNTGSTAATVTFSKLSLGLGTVPTGSSVGLAHYDPSQAQNGWNAHCAFGSAQVQVTSGTNGSTGTFTPNANLTIYPGATLWFAPYAYPTALTAVPTAPPPATAVTPSPAPAPASLTGTYVGSAMQTSPSQQAAQYLQISLTQTGTSVSGSLAALPNGPNQGGFTGTLSGTVGANGAVTMTATPTNGSGNCPATITGTASGAFLNGTFTSQSCGSNSGGSGTFSVTLQTAPSPLPTLSGTYSGPITDSGPGGAGAGTLTLTITTPGTVFFGTATVTFANPNAGGTSPLVGFVVNATTAEFGVIGTNNNNNNNNNNGGSCTPFGTMTISGRKLTGNYTNSGGSTANGVFSCSGTGTFVIQ